MIIIRLRSIFIRSYIGVKVFLYKAFSNIEKVQGKPVRNQPVLCIGKGKIIFKENVQIGYYPSPAFFNTYAHLEARGQNAVIEIGNNVIISNNISMICDNTKITIGDHTLIGINCQIYDADFHNAAPDKRLMGGYKQAEVVIDKNVWIGNNVIILKGVNIGYNSVIGAGSIVTESIPDNVIAAGNPARVIKKLER